MNVIDRRKLLQTVGVAAAGLAINAAGRERAQGGEQATRQQKAGSGKDARLLVGCCAISSHLRVFAGKLPPDATTEQGVASTAEVMKAASEYAAKRGITLGLEPISGITQRADTLLEIIRRADSPYAGINLDITHFIPTGQQDDYAQIKACIPYATQTHIRYRFDSGELIDLDRVWQMFAKGGYKGYMSAEYENEKEDAITGVPRLIDDMRKLSRKYSSV